MTIYLPLEGSSPFPSSPYFLQPSPEPASQLQKVIKTILKAKRVAVVCGAGISVKAGIPDFRSSDGLFQSLKRDNPTLSSGKDLFDASVFNAEATTSLFCQMIAQLSELSDSAAPTSFHNLLRALDDRGKLLRVFTQNIDALEAKAGLTFGVPEQDVKRSKPRSTKSKGDVSQLTEESSAQQQAREESASTSRLPSPPAETPRCIPLHGTLKMMHCQICLHSFPLQDHIESLSAGTPPFCPECVNMEHTRQMCGKRSRGIGKLRPSVVLYNEDHKDGELVGEVVRRDLVGNSKGKGRAGADVLLVVGTSLRVPGTKRIVREFSKAVRSRSAPVSKDSSSSSGEGSSSKTTMGLLTPTPSPRRSPAVDEEPPTKVVYLNLDFPVPVREWEGVFDVWIRGDAQTFAQMMQEEIQREEQAKLEASEKKKRREEKREEAAAAAALAEKMAAEKAALEEKEKKSKKKAAAANSKKRKNAPVAEKPTKPAKQAKFVPYNHITPPSSNSSTTSTSSGTKTRKTRAPPSRSVKVVPPPETHSENKSKSSEGKLTIRLRKPLIPEVLIPPPPPKSTRSKKTTSSTVTATAHKVENALASPSRSVFTDFLTPPSSPLSPVPSHILSPPRHSTSAMERVRPPSVPCSPTRPRPHLEHRYASDYFDGSSLTELNLDDNDEDTEIDIMNTDGDDFRYFAGVSSVESRWPISDIRTRR